MDRDIKRGIGYFRPTEFDPSVIEKMVEAGYLKMAKANKVRKKESFAPSSIGYGHSTCPRFWYIAFEGVTEFIEDPEAISQANMAYGKEAHTRLEKVFELEEALVAANVEVKMDDPPIRGYVDALIRVGEETIVGEFKTAKQEIFMHRMNTMKPAPYHLYQLLIYLRATGKKHGFILYENKNDQSILVIPVSMDEFNRKVLEDALNWLREVYANWQEEGDTLPMRPWTKKNKNCKGCPVFDACWNDLPDGNKKMIPMEVVK